VKEFFGGENPVGKFFEEVEDEGGRTRFQVVGLVGDACYRDVRECVLPTVYVPFRSEGLKQGRMIVRTAGANPSAMAPTLRRAISQARPEFFVTRSRTQQEINDAQTVRERLLATLALFFAAVALLLEGVGMYGVLHYSVLQRQHELGIRIAVGARAWDIAGHLSKDVLVMVAIGAVAGVALGIASVRFMETLFYEVKATDLPVMAFPVLTMLSATLLAAILPIIRAVQIDPASMLRAE
jgi:putative ABC transport system permease protein